MSREEGAWEKSKGRKEEGVRGKGEVAGGPGELGSGPNSPAVCHCDFFSQVPSSPPVLETHLRCVSDELRSESVSYL